MTFSKVFYTNQCVFTKCVFMGKNFARENFGQGKIISEKSDEM